MRDPCTISSPLNSSQNSLKKLKERGALVGENIGNEYIYWSNSCIALNECHVIETQLKAH